MAFVEVRFATQQAVATDGCSKGLENREEGMASRPVCLPYVHAGWCFVSYRGWCKGYFWSKTQALCSLCLPGLPRSPISAAHCSSSMLFPCSCPLIAVLVVTPQFPQPCRYFTMAFPFASCPYRKGEFSSLFIHSHEVMLYLLLQGCVMPFRCSPQSELFLKIFRGSF